MRFSDFLEVVPAFEEFTRPELDLLERAMVVRDFPDGHVFVQEGSSADTMHLIVEGKVLVKRRRPEGIGTEVLGQLQAGEIFGLVALIDHGVRTATCVAEGPVRTASLPRTAFELLFKGDARIGYHFQKLIARQMVHDIRIATASLMGKVVAHKE